MPGQPDTYAEYQTHDADGLRRVVARGGILHEPEVGETVSAAGRLWRVAAVRHIHRMVEIELTRYDGLRRAR